MLVSKTSHLCIYALTIHSHKQKVLGASGDLAGKKTYPAIFSLLRNGLMPENVHITGYARSKLDRNEYVKRITAHLKDASEEQKNKFLEVTDYFSGQYDQDDSWKALNEHLDKLEEKRGLKEGRRNRVFYMALPPSVFVTVARGLRKFVYTDKGHNRIVVEKPFGKDLESSTELAKDLGELFKEEEVYAISFLYCFPTHASFYRFIVLTIILARRWSRISCHYVLPI